jgi:hypothetical protein
MTEMTRAERMDLIRLAKARAKQAEREAETQQKVHLAEVQDLLTAEFSAHDQLWSEAVALAKEAAAKANAQIKAQCADLGIPPEQAPGLQMSWQPRGGQFADKARRAELRKLAESRVAALTKTAKTAIQGAVLGVEEQLLMGGLESSEAKSLFAAMPTVEQLMPALNLEDLGVKSWQPPEDSAAQLTTPLTPTDRKRRRVLRAIHANPGASDRQIAAIAGCDHKTVAAHRPNAGGEFPTTTVEFLKVGSLSLSSGRGEPETDAQPAGETA